MSDSITIRFRAKLADFPDGAGYRVPKLTASHVAHSGGTRGRLFVADLGNGRVTAARLERLGVGPVVLAAAPGPWAVAPIGRGFMADVSATLELSR